jgi:integrase
VFGRFRSERYAYYAQFQTDKLRVVTKGNAYMTISKTPNGAPIASDVPSVSRNCARTTTNVNTIAELLTAIGINPPSHFQMLRTTAGRIESFLGSPTDQITLDAIYARREDFRPFLEKNRYKENSIRSYVNYLRMLLEAAEALGWKPFACLNPDWQYVLRLAKQSGCLAIAKYHLQIRSTPSAVTPEDTGRWLDLKVQQGTKYVTVKSCVDRFWRILVDCGHGENAPPVYSNNGTYGIPFSEFPAGLRDDVKELLRWKCAEYEPDRPRRAKIRKISARRLQQALSKAYGYAVNVRNTSGIASLPELLQKPIMGDYISWSLNERKKQGTTFATEIGQILAAVSAHPAYKSLDWTWMKKLKDGIPCDSFEEVKERKARKYLEYDALEKIPARIHSLRESAAKRGEKVIASVVQSELLIKWLLILPWRQRNIRECRIGGAAPNLFRGKIPPFTYIDKPLWVTKEEALNPDAKFWQFRFSKEETKTGISVHALLPRPLIDLLEEYLAEYRGFLVSGRCSETLFVSSSGAPMDTEQVSDLVSDLTLRHGGRRVTPHLFRDIVAFAWLKAHPKDYLTLSKMLWHKNISTTINYYGSRFNESSASVAMESWVEAREARSSPNEQS